jgi:hypothetical protein
MGHQQLIHICQRMADMGTRIRGRSKVNFPTLANDGPGWGTLRSIFSPHLPKEGGYGHPIKNEGRKLGAAV